MGMDVMGKAASSKTGEYFRNNVWWWRRLAIYCCEVAPAITSACKSWHYNDGDGLDAEGAIKLADALDAEIAAGRTVTYERIYNGRLEMTPDEDCTICGGTGRRKEAPMVGAGDLPCNGCDSKGHRHPDSTFYPFSVDNVREFAAFLRASGGFRIC